MNLKETYDLIAEHWHRDHLKDDWWVEGTTRFTDLLPSGGTVLDVGCGSGVVSKYLLEKGFTVSGIDISENLLAIAKREAPNGTFDPLSMLELDRLNETFDGLYAKASLLHIPKTSAAVAVQKMADRLVSGGFLYIAVKEMREGGLEEEVLRENDYGFTYERFFSYFTEKELEFHIVAAGLKPVMTLRAGTPTAKTIWLQIIAQKI